jgi:AhpD family alkylhydroperoxidase
LRESGDRKAAPEQENGNVGDGKERIKMNRQQVYKQIEEAFGLVPSFFKKIPDSSLEQEWELFKRVQLDEGPVPNKYRELIGLGIAAVTKCRYCAFYHTELAKVFGATDAEIEDAVHYAKASAGWSAYANGLQIDFEQFQAEVLQACEHARSVHSAK